MSWRPDPGDIFTNAFFMSWGPYYYYYYYGPPNATQFGKPSVQGAGGKIGSPERSHNG